jgi:hypothetical protein
MKTLHRGMWQAALAIAALAAIAGAALGQGQAGFVRVERLEPGAPPNAHPYAVSADALRARLAALGVAGTVSTDAVPIFTDEELDQIAAPLAERLARAGPQEDVTFAAIGKHGLLGKFSPSSVTTGRLFARGDALNLILGLVHERYESSDLGFKAPEFRPGQRTQRLAPIHRVVTGAGARLAEKRADWVIFEAGAPAAPWQSRAPAAPAPAAVPSTPAATPAPTVSAEDARYRDIKRRLELLDRLKSDGLISEGEYRERRRAILDGI